jgi:hypothetical protein
MSRLTIFVTTVWIVTMAAAFACASAVAAPFELEAGVKTATLKAQPKALEAFVLSATGQPKIECSEISFKRGELQAGSETAVAESFRLEKCIDLTEPTKCEVPTIASDPITARLETVEGKKTRERFKPQTGTELAVFKLKNKGTETCEAGVANRVLKGTMTTSTQDNTTLAFSHPLPFEILESSGELKYAEKTATFKGEGVLEAESLAFNPVKFALG